jgi:para-aminobenzoate synthetase component 1
LIRTRATQRFEADELRSIKDKMLNWASRFGICLFMDSNGYADRYGRYECLVGAGSAEIFTAGGSRPFEAVSAAQRQHSDWIFLQLAYDLKNRLEPRLESRHPAKLYFGDLTAFRPQTVAFIRRDSNELVVETLEPAAHAVLKAILAGGRASENVPSLQFDSRLDRASYLQKIAALKHHIREGDCYEINFCNEAYAERVNVDPLAVFNRLNALSPAPFAAFYKDQTRFMMGASPERFVCRRGDELISQPIKGTARRGSGPEEDAQIIAALRSSEKERAENVMITDLVRNDLAMVSEPGSVEVEELFGIYSYPQVHQMISTVKSRLRRDLGPLDAIQSAFPMGSMTGAPKYRVMQLIEEHEVSRRELYSGSVGYIDPAGDFDLNVVIRSLFYNQDTSYLSYHTGGAITWDSDPEAEWDEIRLKAAAMERVFS